MREIDKTLPKDQRILLAAEEVFSRRGYVQATLDEIIALADTGKGTVYKYFGNKDNLFYTLVASKIEPFLQCLQEVVASVKSTSEKIRSYMLALLPFLRDNKDLYRILWYEVSGNQRGFHPVFLNDGSWEMSSLYGDTLSEDEYNRVLPQSDQGAGLMSGNDHQRRHGDWLYEAGAAYDHGSPFIRRCNDVGAALCGSA